MNRKPLPTKPSHDKATNRAYVYWNGKKTYFGTWDSLETARKFSEWLIQHTDGNEISPLSSSRFITECIESFILHSREYYSENGKPTQEFRNLSSSMDALIRHGFAGKRADEFGPKSLLDLQSLLINEMTTKNGAQERRYSRKTINSHINRIRRMFRWCASRELIPASIVTALEMVDGLSHGRTKARESGRVKPVPISDVVATLPFVSPTVAVMIHIQTLAGMRPQDVCRMTWSAIDKTGDIWLYRPAHHKTKYLGKSLVKAIPPAARTILEGFLREDPDEPLFSPVDSLEYWRSIERKRPVTSPPKPKNRTPYTTASYGKAIKYGIERAGNQTPPIKIPHWAPNQLRHLIATEVREQSGIEAAQLYLGHSKVDVTLLYAEASEAKLIEIARKVVSPLSPKKPEQPPPE